MPLTTSQDCRQLVAHGGSDRVPTDRSQVGELPSWPGLGILGNHRISLGTVSHMRNESIIVNNSTRFCDFRS